MKTWFLVNESLSNASNGYDQIHWEIRKKRFIEGTGRTQTVLFPAALDDYVAEDNAVRVVDVFVVTLNFEALGFDGALPADTGRPSYHPSILLKIYIYGYLNRI